MIEQRFSAAADTYDLHARPQLALARALVALLPGREHAPARILELGAGTGQLTRLLAERFPGTPIDAVDLAPRMVEHSRKRFAHLPQVNWKVGDAQTHRPAAPYPLVASSSALHWVDNLRATFENIFQCLEPGGLFALGIMLEGTLKELHGLRREIAPQKGAASHLPACAETEGNLKAAGFSILRKIHSEERIVYSDARAFLRAIHEQGVTGGRVGAGRAPLTRTELARLAEAYQERFAVPGGVSATYETALFLLRKHK